MPSKTHLAQTHFHSEIMDNFYPDHVNTLCEAGLAPPSSPTMGELWKSQDEKMDIEKEKEPGVNKQKTKMSNFVLRTHVVFLYVSTE